MQLAVLIAFVRATTAMSATGSTPSHALCTSVLAVLRTRVIPLLAGAARFTRSPEPCVAPSVE